MCSSVWHLEIFYFCFISFTTMHVLNLFSQLYFKSHIMIFEDVKSFYIHGLFISILIQRNQFWFLICNMCELLLIVIIFISNFLSCPLKGIWKCQLCDYFGNDVIFSKRSWVTFCSSRLRYATWQDSAHSFHYYLFVNLTKICFYIKTTWCLHPLS